jgi:hypothetical protein
VGGVGVRYFGIARDEMFEDIDRHDGVWSLERNVATNAHLARIFRRSQSNMSYAIGRLRQRVCDREHKIR